MACSPERPGFADSGKLIPSPPQFQRDFAEALLQFSLMSQLMASDTVFLTQSRFHVNETKLDWTLVLVPDGPSVAKLNEVLQGE